MWMHLDQYKGTYTADSGVESGKSCCGIKHHYTSTTASILEVILVKYCFGGKKSNPE